MNQMIAKESVRTRLDSEHGISYTEFSYMLLQANDFAWLCEHHDVELQAGGSDQWGNITAGIDLIRRRLARSAHGLTHPLLTRSDGQKMGKSVAGAVWLDPDKTSPYQFQQYWVQVPDADVERFLLQLTLRPVSETAEVMASHWETPERRSAQRLLARDVTALVHGPEAAQNAEAAADVLFGGDPTTVSADVLADVGREVPSTLAPPSVLDDLVTLLVQTGLATSKSDARRGLEQGAFSANGRRLAADDRLAVSDLLHGRYALVSKGRKNHHLLEISREAG